MKLIEFTRPKIDFEKMKEIKKEFKKRGIPFVDRHTHSITKYTESLDLSKSPPIEGPSLNVLNTAFKIGLDEFAITDHSYEIFLFPEIEERTKLQLKYGDQTFREYVSYLERVKKQISNFKILGGIELKIRDLNDLRFINSSDLKCLDLILIETGIKCPDFGAIRQRIGKDTTIIFAHPDPGYSLGNDPEEKIVDN